MNAAANKGRRTLLLLALVFLGPMGIAMALYYTGFQWRPQGSTEHGELYQPPRPLPELDLQLLGEGGGNAGLRGKWTFIYAGPGDCATACREALVEMRQVRRALGRDMERVQRLYLVTGGEPDLAWLATEHPGLDVAAGGEATNAVLQAIGEAPAGSIFLADPLGNLVMRYPAGTGMKGMHQDLQRLLKISTIG